MMLIEGDVVEKSPNKNGGISMKKLLSIALSLCLLLSVALADGVKVTFAEKNGPSTTAL